MPDSISLVHYMGTYLNKSETFIGRFVNQSTAWGRAVVIAEKFNHLPNISLDNETLTRYQIPQFNYSRGSVIGFGRYIRERIQGANKHTLFLKAYLDVLKPSIVHCHFGRLGIRYAKACQSSNLDIPFVVSFYGYDATKLPQKDLQYKKELALIFEQAAGVFVEGPQLKNEVTALGANPDKVLINPLLIPVSEYPEKTNWYQNGRPCTFLCAGRFVEKKGFHLFFEAIGKIQDELPDFNIEVIGEGPMRGKYEEVIEKHGLSNHIEFLGWKSYPDLLQHIKKADFFVHPSVVSSDGDSEGGAPTILLEAQAIKTPVIASRHADIPYVMGYDDFLCKEGDIESLRSVILNAVNSNDLLSLAEEGYYKVLCQHNISSDIYRKNIESVL